MILTFNERLSDSPFVERVWSSQSVTSGAFVSVAVSHWEMVVSRYEGKMTVTVRGPETKATMAHCPSDGEWVGIRFKLGTSLRQLSAKSLVDGAVNLPEAASKGFWLHSSAWQFPTYDNAEIFVDRLVRDGLLWREPVVDAALQGQLEHQLKDLSLRSVQRRFLQATGLTHGAVRQIERARHATLLLKQGVSILDTVDQAGYADQPHLTRSLKHLIGQTPAQMMGKGEPQQLSFLFNTEPLS